MSKTRNNVSLFDEDFEVTYEEDVPFTYNFETKPVSKPISDETIVIPTPSRKASALVKDDFDDIRYADDFDDDDHSEDRFDDDYDNSNNNRSSNNPRNRNKTSYDEDDYDYDNGSYNRKKRLPKSRAYSSSSPRASRFLPRKKKSAKYGTKQIYKVARSVVRFVSLAITAGTLGMLAYNFWRGAAPYGDPQTILTEQNYALLSYAAVAAFFLLFEFLAFFWSMTKMRIREERKVYKEDTGRGLFSFIFIYIASYVSFLLCSFLPDTLGSYAVLNGIKGALDVFGSLHNVLLGLCAAGVISCLVRRNML